MAVVFKKTDDVLRFMNPSNNFRPDELKIEIRYDPLTGQTSRLFDLGYRPPASPDLDKLVKDSQNGFCPFCPDNVEKVTPLFPGDIVSEGRVHMGDSVLFPNLLPLDRYAGVCVINRKRHYIPLAELTPENLKDAFKACIRLIELITANDSTTEFFNINWNYLPPAGSSIIHPHLQVNCGAVPSRQFRIQMDSSSEYYHQHGSVFWNDYVSIEKKLGERFICDSGGTAWLLSYAPQSVIPDFWCIFPGHCSIAEIDDYALMSFLKGIGSAIRYFANEGFYSFNVALFSHRNADHFRVNARVCPRTHLQAIGNSDQTYYQVLHREPCSLRIPEKELGKVVNFFDI